MVAETAREFETLEEHARTLLGVFIKAGHEAVSPAVIQPADVYLDVIGESLRGRSYVFPDTDGDELCLRPDLTVPTCRLHLERHEDGDKKAKYCYNGTAFRFQPVGAGAAHPREFRQAGIEAFGNPDREKADAATLALVFDGLRAAGLKDWKLRIGDLGLFRAVLEAADMPGRWRQRLMHQFWRPEAFRAELRRLTQSPADNNGAAPRELLEALDPNKPAEAVAVVSEYLETANIEMIGARTIEEISDNLLMIVADQRAEPLSERTAALISNYIGVAAPARAAGARLKDLMHSEGINISEALDSYHRRLQLLADAGVDVLHADFSAEFGRMLEYYTGFVFEVIVPSLGDASPVAGGGRYDSLMRMCGAPNDVPAVGGAVHTERLLAALRE